MKRLVFTGLSCILLLCLCACGTAQNAGAEQTGVVTAPESSSSTEESTSAENSSSVSTSAIYVPNEKRVLAKPKDGKWGVTVEKIDIESPQNKKYAQWYAERPSAVLFEADWNPEDDDNTWTTKKVSDSTTEKTTPWNDKQDIVFFDSLEPHGGSRDAGVQITRIYVQDKATGKRTLVAEKIDEKDIDFRKDVLTMGNVLDSTHFFYYGKHFNYIEGFESALELYLYNGTTGESLLVADSLGTPLEKDGKRLLWTRFEKDKTFSYYVTDINQLVAGKKDAIRKILNIPNVENSYTGYNGDVFYVSKDMRYAYLDAWDWRDKEAVSWDGKHSEHYRWIVYDIETGKTLSSVILPEDAGEGGIMLDENTLYVYDWNGNKNVPLYILRYTR